MAKIIPSEGLITIADLADYMGTTPQSVQQALSNNGIRVMRISQRYSQRIVSLRAVDKWLSRPIAENAE